jgi:glyoxylase-like metal-dependent hydrolase (beta-lactamase superfamily II)
VFQIDASLPASRETVAVYVLKGSKVAVVDCGYPSTYESVLQGLREVAIQPSDVSFLIPTHLHLDHGGGAGHLLQHTSNAQVIAHERGVPHFIDPTILINSATSIFGEEIIRTYGTPIPIPKERIESVETEQQLDLGEGLSITAFHTPGHAPHQISLFLEEEKLLLTADAVGMTLPQMSAMIPTTPPPSFNLSKFVDTLNKLVQLDSKTLLTPHYGPRKDTRRTLEETKSKTENWLMNARQLAKNGLDVNNIVEHFTESLAKESGVRRTDVGSFVQVGVRISVLGILSYLEKNPG